MAPETPLTALLREQPEERLVEWRDRLAEQISQLQFEKRIVEQALLKRPRRPSRSAASKMAASAANPSSDGRFAGLPRHHVYQLVREHGQPVTPAQVVDLLAARDLTAKVEPVRTALNRLVKIDGLLVKLGPSLFAVPDESNRNGDGEPLSRATIFHSQESEARLGS